LVRRFRHFREGLDGESGLPPREARSVRKAPGRFNCGRDFGWGLDRPLLDGLTDQLTLLVARVPERTYKRERRLALGQVVAEVLAGLVALGAVIERVVDELERGAQVPAVAGHGVFQGGGRIREDRGNLGAVF